MISFRNELIPIVLSASVVLAAPAAPAYACELTCEGHARHQTGDKGGGCFGLDPDDRVAACQTDPPDASYRLFTGPGCTGSEVASGRGRLVLDPPLSAASVRLACKPGT
jgi:hypothetical protein